MTKDEIIEMAIREAEFVSHGQPSEEESELFVCSDKDIVRFYNFVTAKEREACMKACEKTITSQRSAWGANFCIEAIKARGQA